MENWSEQDKRVNKLTGFVPGDRSKRKCISCGKTGHYYYECNNGQFLAACDALVDVLKLTTKQEE